MSVFQVVKSAMVTHLDHAGWVPPVPDLDDMEWAPITTTPPPPAKDITPTPPLATDLDNYLTVGKGIYDLSIFSETEGHLGGKPLLFAKAVKAAINSDVILRKILSRIDPRIVEGIVGKVDVGFQVFVAAVWYRAQKDLVFEARHLLNPPLPASQFSTRAKGKGKKPEVTVRPSTGYKPSSRRAPGYFPYSAIESPDALSVLTSLTKSYPVAPTIAWRGANSAEAEEPTDDLNISVDMLQEEHVFTDEYFFEPSKPQTLDDLKWTHAADEITDLIIADDPVIMAFLLEVCAVFAARASGPSSTSEASLIPVPSGQVFAAQALQNNTVTNTTADEKMDAKTPVRQPLAPLNLPDRLPTALNEFNKDLHLGVFNSHGRASSANAKVLWL
ncbi:hypothetical protein C8R43DRAFT_1142293 [Mycena crocata]|nr:hypothetical protein C8R43DRAFT_1142293 [Mycena crocata]